MCLNNIVHVKENITEKNQRGFLALFDTDLVICHHLWWGGGSRHQTHFGPDHRARVSPPNKFKNNPVPPEAAERVACVEKSGSR